MSMMNAVVWFDIYVEDMTRAVRFYEEVLDQKLEPLNDPTGESQMMAFSADMEKYGAAGALVKADYGKACPGGTQVYFSVEDCAVQQERLVKAGGTLVRPKFSIGEFGFIVIGQDSEGNIIGFNSMK